VKGIVSDIEGFDKAIRTACTDNGDSDSDFDSDSDEELGSKQAVPRGIKEVDYKLILDFARRISKYNHEAVADVATGAAGKRQGPEPQTGDKDVNMSGTNGEQPTEDGAEPVASVTKNATQWLDDSANATREVYMLPYPMEERIRMGLMAQIQLAPGGDPEKEMERLLAEADGRGAAEPPAPVEPAQSRQTKLQRLQPMLDHRLESLGRLHLLLCQHQRLNPRRPWISISMIPMMTMIESFTAALRFEFPMIPAMTAPKSHSS
jgi:hypothetical protein